MQHFLPIRLTLFGTSEPNEAPILPDGAEHAPETEALPAASEEIDLSEWIGAEISEAENAEHIASLERQAAEVRQTFPDFDLAAELRNPLFARMTAADVGVSVEDAYYAVHRKEIMQKAAKATAEKITNAIRSGSRRPIESGASSQAPSVSTFDYAKASRSQREAFKKDLLARMARGEKVYPNRNAF